MNPVLIGLIVVVAAVGGLFGWVLNNRFGAKSLEAARAFADEMKRSARREMTEAKRKSLADTKQEILQTKNKADRDLRSRNKQITKRERELRSTRQQIEEERKAHQKEVQRLGQREQELDERDDELERLKAEAEALLEEQNDRLERVSGMTRDEARRQLLANLKASTRLDAAQMIREIKDEAQRSADKEAQKIIALAIERAASEFSSTKTIQHFALPEGSDLKGRIIGQEGKNIRAFEQVTGIQLLIDEETNTVTLSGYNPVGREIARRVLETLVKDGNIHPRRIEEQFKRKKKRVEEEMRRAGQEALKELNIKKMHPDLVLLAGRLKYRTSYGQNVLQHSKEVAYLTGMMAAELRLDEKLARRAGFLHDVGKAIDYEREGTHPEIGAEVATDCGEHEWVVNAIASHHEDCEMTSPISVLVAAADALSGARPGARRKTVAEYIKRIEKLEELANSMDGVDTSYALQAGREIRVIARSKQVDDARCDLLASDLAGRIESEMDYPGKIKVTVIRELRANDTAR